MLRPQLRWRRASWATWSRAGGQGCCTVAAKKAGLHTAHRSPLWLRQEPGAAPRSSCELQLLRTLTITRHTGNEAREKPMTGWWICARFTTETFLPLDMND